MTSREIAGILLDAGAVKISFDPPFTYTSGMRAPIYTDNRVLISLVKERGAVVAAIAGVLKDLGVAENGEVFLAGTSTAGIPWASFLAERLAMPMVYVRPKPKEHGAGKQVEGSLKRGARVVVVEDLATTGGSSVGTVQALRRESDAEVRDVVVIFTYGFEKMYRVFDEVQVKLHALSDFSTLLDIARERGLVNDEQYAKILQYKADPEGWAAKMGLA
jgi:orotate phosphoribosyltransferase